MTSAVGSPILLSPTNTSMYSEISCVSLACTFVNALLLTCLPLRQTQSHPYSVQLASLGSLPFSEWRHRWQCPPRSSCPGHLQRWSTGRAWERAQCEAEGVESPSCTAGLCRGKQDTEQILSGPQENYFHAVSPIFIGSGKPNPTVYGTNLFVLNISAVINEH